MRLIDLVEKSERRLVFYIGSFPGAALMGVSLKEVYFSPLLLAETACYLAEQFQPDFIRPITDLVVEAEALGLKTRYSDESAPILEEHPIASLTDLGKLKIPDPYCDGRLPVNIEAIRLIKKKTEKMVIGSLTGPFTLAGALSGPTNVILKAVTDPYFLHSLLTFTTQVLKRYGEALLGAGADILWISEPLGSLLSPAQFWQFSGQYIREIFLYLPAMNILHICGDTTYMIKELVATGAQGLSLDTAVNLVGIAREVPENVVLIGNIDPVGVMLEGTPEQVENVTKNLLLSMQSINNFILSTGCTLPLNVPPENIRVFVTTAKSFPRLSPSHSKLLGSLQEVILKGDKEKVLDLVKQGLNIGLDAMAILHGALIPGVNRAGELYQQQAIFIPELLLITQAMYAGLEIIKPILLKDNSATRGRIVLGTVQGDLHDIGKNLVGLMLAANAYEVIDLGKDVSPSQFLEAAQKYRPDIIGLSALTTTTMKSMEKTVQVLKKEKLDKVKIIVGGAPVSEEFARKIGADAYASDALGAVNEVARLLRKKGN
ncbi:methyltransferase, MtaA/CmuA family [Thermanaeromonas toyohensis ToBE]|uniref:Methyltransferase, MtaA/CmuA family n=1 Tax=Thermanaeromonas toyohensis ToBE TaxID=698762 RepID=A0A1W1W130_9FIRM|nr:uroporphyrinogen decarboxylase family protein [Thermanaeromonas toyohensis]SMB99308.1 methyltransferase, MtaA/CmuA family [Thermanaeromonas toyohensis ToBE]